ncbi:MAG: hypothetical protein Q9210_005666 [Variospora velana]
MTGCRCASVPDFHSGSSRVSRLLPPRCCDRQDPNQNHLTRRNLLKHDRFYLHSKYNLRRTNLSLRFPTPLPLQILPVIQEVYLNTRRPRGPLSAVILPQLAERWPGAIPLATLGRGRRRRDRLSRRLATSLGHLYVNIPVDINVPNFARLDIPNAEGRSITINVRGRLEAKSEETSIPTLVASSQPPPPNAPYDSYPMIISLLRRPCVLHAPWWDSDTGPQPGHTYPLTQAESQEHRTQRAEALRDLRQYGSPDWLVRESVDKDAAWKPVESIEEVMW